jgi:hypothetical protein
LTDANRSFCIETLELHFLYYNEALGSNQPQVLTSFLILLTNKQQFPMVESNNTDSP